MSEKAGRRPGGAGRPTPHDLLLTVLWSLLSIDTFQKVTGPKTDLWLVKTVGVIGAVLGVSGLAAVDVFYVAKGRISPVYLLDAAAELALAGGLTLASGSGDGAG